MSTPTLKTISKATGFSVTTVSRALGGYDDVSEETRQIILAEARRQGYEPNLNARLLQGGRTQTIGLIMSIGGRRSPDPFFSEFIAGVSNQATLSGYDLLLNADTHGATEVDTYRRLVSRGRVDGLILVRARHRDPRITYLLSADIPFVVFGRTDHTETYSYIDMDGVAAQALLTRHFIQLGHRRIAYAAPPLELMFTDFRIQGYRHALEEAAIPFQPEWLLHGELTEQSGRDLAHRLLELSPAPTAIMAGNDLMAFGVMRAIQERGLRVGEEVAVGGFDDVPTAEHIHPGLTTIRQPIYEVGQQLVTLLIQRIRGEVKEDIQQLLQPELIIRASSGSPKGKEFNIE